MRTVLELLDARRRRQGLSHSLRTLQRRAERTRATMIESDNSHWATAAPGCLAEQSSANWTSRMKRAGQILRGPSSAFSSPSASSVVQVKLHQTTNDDPRRLCLPRTCRRRHGYAEHGFGTADRLALQSRPFVAALPHQYFPYTQLDSVSRPPAYRSASCCPPPHRLHPLPLPKSSASHPI